MCSRLYQENSIQGRKEGLNKKLNLLDKKKDFFLSGEANTLYRCYKSPGRIILLGPRQRLPGRVEEVLGRNRGQRELHQVIMTGRGSMSRHGLNMSKEKVEGRRNWWCNLL